MPQPNRSVPHPMTSPQRSPQPSSQSLTLTREPAHHATTPPASLKLPERFNVSDHFLPAHPTPAWRAQPYLICGEAVLTRGEALDRTNQSGHALRRLGVRPGDRVALLLREGLEFPPVFWGAVRIGAVPVPLNPVLLSRDFAYYLEDSQASCLVVDPALWEKIAPIRAGLRHVRHLLSANGEIPGLPRLETLRASEAVVLESEQGPPERPAFWLYTSGSTGAPKGAVHHHGAMVWAAEHYMKGLQGLRPGEVTFSAPKFYFAYGLGNSLYGPLALDTTAVIQPEIATARNCLTLLARHRPVAFYAVPTLINALLNLYAAWRRGEEDPPAVLPRLEHLRYTLSAGETLPVTLYRRWLETFGSPLLDGIGSTEMLHFYVSNVPQRYRAGVTGALIPGYDVRLVDGQGGDCPPGTEGELWVRGGSMATGYWNQPERTQAAFREGWLITGDRFIRDAEGFYQYRGRADDMMKIGGSWVSPSEVEDVLLAHPAVAECAVAGRYDADGLMKAHAFVVPAAGSLPWAALEPGLRDYTATRLPPFKVPFAFHAVEALPKTASGKIRRFLLRDATQIREP
ncbi:MAG: benzoate-CoA ligase family protein [Deltaproteobacteria bacterium]|nr:benzoate-CoA ligase family protein [Deltaproteobacteria bacterium]